MDDAFWATKGALEAYARLSLPTITRLIVSGRYEHLDGFAWYQINFARSATLHR